MQVKGNILQMSQHKFASNVVEKCVLNANKKDRAIMIEEIVTTRPDGYIFISQCRKKERKKKKKQYQYQMQKK